MARLKPHNPHEAAAMMRSAERSGVLKGDEFIESIEWAREKHEMHAEVRAAGPTYDSLVSYPKPEDTNEATPAVDDAELQRKLDLIAPEAGVYLLKEKGKVLYVGKAKSLRSRVRAYFRGDGAGRFQVRF